MQEQENKPFWGPHRYLQTIVLIRSILTCAAINAITWSIECEGPQLCQFDRINGSVVSGVAVVFNQLYYLYQHTDMSFGAKILVQVSNAGISWWLMVVLFASISRLCIVVVREPIQQEIGAVIGIIYCSYAFVKQLKQMLEGFISITISCYTVATRKPPQKQTINPEQLNQMRDRLKTLQSSRSSQYAVDDQTGRV